MWVEDMVSDFIISFFWTFFFASFFIIPSVALILLDDIVSEDIASGFVALASCASATSANKAPESATAPTRASIGSFDLEVMAYAFLF